MLPEHAIRLSGRSSSHFTRVAALFAHELGLAFELDVVHPLTSLDPATYGGHPALKVPTLHVGDASLFGTDNICRKLAEVAGRDRDPRVVRTEHLQADVARNAQELVWHAMGAQVQLLVGTVYGSLPADDAFFVKARTGMEGALRWLETHLERVVGHLPAPRDVSVLEVTTFCLLDHIAFRPTVQLTAFPTLRIFAATFASRESARRTMYRTDPRPITTGGAP
jgi:glutathione S-transferase